MLIIPSNHHLPTHYPLQTQLLRWVKPSSKEAVANKVDAGHQTFICHAKYNNAVYPGHLTEKGCVITYNNQMKIATNYQILTASKPSILVWKVDQTDRDNYYEPQRFYGVLPENSNLKEQITIPVIGGYESQTPNYLHALKICRVLYQNDIKVGKVVINKCHVAIDGSEQGLLGYQVLNIKATSLINTPHP